MHAVTHRIELNGQTIVLEDNPAIAARRAHYEDIDINVAAVLQSWRSSLAAHEWMTADGHIRHADELGNVQARRQREVEDRIASGRELSKPVLGIGLLDNIEIGAARPVFMVLASMGVASIPVHIPLCHIEDFESLCTAPPS